MQVVEASIPGATADSLHRYLHTDPSRIMYACWDREYLERQNDELFKIFLKEQQVCLNTDTNSYSNTCTCIPAGL